MLAKLLAQNTPQYRLFNNARETTAWPTPQRVPAVIFASYKRATRSVASILYFAQFENVSQSLMSPLFKPAVSHF
jgi:hypothetical protein